MSPIKTSKMTNYRWVICAMLFFATTVNYMDRQVLSLTYPGEGGIQQEFGWSDDNYGTITAYFSIIYALCMLFAGKFVDWMGISGQSSCGRRVLCCTLSVALLPVASSRATGS